MITIYRMYVRRNLLDSYPTVWAYVGELFAIYLNLLVFWYTAKAFAPTFGENMNYFEFVVWGEILLTIPLSLLISSERAVRTSILDGSLDAMILSPRPISAIFILNSLGTIPKEACRILVTLLLATILFGFHLPTVEAWAVLSLQLLSVPLFLGLGLCVAGVFLIVGRGTGLVHHLSLILSISAGVYFPLNVFSQQTQGILKALSPYTLLLENSRSILAGHLEGLMTSTIWPLSVWAAIAMAVGVTIFQFSFLQVRRRGSAPLLT